MTPAFKTYCGISAPAIAPANAYAFAHAHATVLTKAGRT